MLELTSRMKIVSSHLTVMGSAALKAGRKLIRDFNEVEHLQISRKGPGDFVTSADLRSEKLIREELQKARPDYGFLLEESGQISGQDTNFQWIVDPLDGTNNFLHALPHFAVSIALQQGSEIIAGVTYDPIKDELFYAAKGQGAYMNDRRLRVSARDQMKDALLGSSFTHHTLKNNYPHTQLLKNYQTLGGHVAGMRRMGSSTLDLCYVSGGRLDGYLGLDLAPWDLATGILMIREAGGYVTDGFGGNQIFESRTILVANDRLHRPILKYLEQQ